MVYFPVFSLVTALICACRKRAGTSPGGGLPQSRAGGLCGALLNQTTCLWNVLWRCLPPPERCCAALENLSERKKLELSLSTPGPSYSTRHTTVLSRGFVDKWEVWDLHPGGHVGRL